MASKNKGNSVLVMGLLCGTAVGAAVALFYTPASGEENRKRLSEWASSRAGDVQSKVKEQASQVQQKVQEKLPGSGSDEAIATPS